MSSHPLTTGHPSTDIDLAKQLVSAIPKEEVKEAVGPLVKRVGRIADIGVGIVESLLLPVTKYVMRADFEREHFREKLIDRAMMIPEDARIPPDPRVAVPILREVPLTENEPQLQEMYARLLATAMNRVTAPSAHPAFVEIIAQLSSDEARMVEALFRVGPPLDYELPCLTVWGMTGPTDGRIAVEMFSELPYIAKCKYPDASPFYINIY